MATKSLYDLSYNKIVAGYMSGAYSRDYLLSEYTKMRKSAMRQVQRTKKAGLKFYGDEPYFTSPKNLITESDIIHAISDINAYRRSKGYTLKGRSKMVGDTISRLKKQGFEVDADNLGRFTAFMAWFRASAYAALYDSDSEEVAEVFNTSNPRGRSRLWSKLFDLYKGT